MPPVEDWLPPAVGFLVILSILSAGLWLRVRRREVSSPFVRIDRPRPEPPLPEEVPERRRALRRRGGSVFVLVSDAQARSRPGQALVVDRSTGGLRLALEDPRDVGAVLSVRVAHTPDLVPWAQLEVRHCQRAGESWEVGCRFLKALPTTVMWQFG